MSAPPVRLPAPLRVEGDHIACELPGAHVLFTTRLGGLSDGPYESLNLGPWTDDDPGPVRANRERAAGLAGLQPAALAQGRQVHAASVQRHTQAPAPGATPRDADGQAANVRGVGPIVLVADCLPVALAGEGAVAMLHAGWRGLAAGVLEAGVAAVRELGATGDLHAAIGPGAGLCCYETGEEVHTALAARRDERDGRRLDLAAIATRRLRAAGVGAVHVAGLCTMCATAPGSEGPLFFSHRRDGGVTGRQAGIARRI